MDRTKILYVKYRGESVGTMAMYKKHYAVFEYESEWIMNGFSISPYSLPLEKKLFIPKIDPFDGLFGLFADSLPDGWGRLLVDRLIRKNHVDPNTLNHLDRLAIVGSSGMGALTYEPEKPLDINGENSFNLDKLVLECKKILQKEDSENLDQLFHLGGSSGGARPKVLTEVDEEDWIIKFPSSYDTNNIGKMEYDYSVCAKKCGVEMAETRLFPSDLCQGYFGVKRFDRNNYNTKRVHMLSVSGLLETSHRIPNLDYDTLFKLTLNLTNDFSEIMKLYRMMCFNVFAHNRDDHSKNFSYLYHEEEGKWCLAPAYDLTYSHSVGGEHATCVDRNGSNPSYKEILSLGKAYGIRESEAKHIAEEIEGIVTDELSRYLKKRGEQ